MKALITLCFAGIAALTAGAQSQPTMLTQSRYSIKSTGATMEDSLVHIHSKGRVSYGLPVVEYNESPNDGVYTADQSLRVYKSGSAISFKLADRITRSFNPYGLVSEYREELKSGSQYEETLKETYHYNAKKQVDTTWADFKDNPLTFRHTYSYKNDVLVAVLIESGGSPGWTAESLDSFIAQGTDSFFVRYSNTMGMKEWERHHYLRDASNRIQVDSLFQLQLKKVTYTSYDAAGRKIKDSVWAAPGGGFIDQLITYSYDNNGNMVSKTKLTSTTVRDTMTYNGANQLTSVQTHTLTNGNWIPTSGSFSRFYYYGFPTSVNGVAAGEPLRLYPVPATSYINIDMSFSKPEKFAVRIYNMQGQIIRQWDEPAQARYNKKIQLDGMPAGNYIIHVSSDNNNITKQFNVLQ